MYETTDCQFTAAIDQLSCYFCSFFVFRIVYHIVVKIPFKKSVISAFQ